MAKKDLSNLGLNRFLTKDYDDSYIDSVSDVSLKASDVSSSVKSGASTFDVSQTNDSLIGKVLKNCSFIDNFYLYNSIGNSNLLAGSLSGAVGPNSRSINLSTSDEVSVLTLFESTSVNYASLYCGSFGLHIGPADFAYPSGVTIDGGFLNLFQMTTAEAGDLTPQDGSMYYDTTLDVPRIRVNGAWKTITTA
jgi:hypothetical protein